MEEAWHLFLKDTMVFTPSDYSFLFPQNLLEQIADEFYTFYQNADLASYPELVRQEKGSIAQLLNDAWYNAQTSPLEYYSYETNAISNLRKDFGLANKV